MTDTSTNQQEEPLTLYTVIFTKIITIEQQMNKRQIDALIKDENVKSINIKK